MWFERSLLELEDLSSILTLSKCFFSSPRVHRELGTNIRTLTFCNGALACPKYTEEAIDENRILCAKLEKKYQSYSGSKSSLKLFLSRTTS